MFISQIVANDDLGISHLFVNFDSSCYCVESCVAEKLSTISVAVVHWIISRLELS